MRIKNKVLSFILTFVLIVSNFMGLGMTRIAYAGTGTTSDPYSVAEAIGIQDNSLASVQGYIVGQPTATTTVKTSDFPNDYAIAIADTPEETDTTKMIYVKVASSFRPQLGLSTNPGNMGKVIKVTGKLAAYFSHPGSIDITAAEFASTDTDKVAAVTADPAQGAVPAGTEVILSTSTADASIYYTTDINAEPDTQYTTPIVVNEPVTIKAVAKKEGMTDSDISTFEYTLLQIITAQEAKGKPNTTKVRVKGIVTYSTQGRTIFMQDDSGGICVDSGSSSKNISGYVGKEIDVVGTISRYGDMVQVTPTSVDDIVITNATPEIPDPLEVSINELKNSNRAYEGKLIKVENAQIKAFGTGTSSTFNHTIAQGSDEITLRAGALTGRNVGDYITITGVAGYFNAPQVQANVSDIVTGDAPPVQNVTADPTTGSKLPIGGTVTLSTSTEGAAITYTLNGGSEQTIDGNSGTVTINAFDPADGTAVIKAKATKGEDSSSQATFTYTQAKTQAVTANPVGAISDTTQITLTAADSATISYIVTKKEGLDDESSDPEAAYSSPIQITVDMLPVKITAYAALEGYLDSDTATFEYYLASNEPYRNYFGQLHSHTAENSDGAGTLAEAYKYARDTAKLDFFAVTDHSNSFDDKPKGDKAGTYNLGAYNKDDPEWVKGQQAATNARTDDFISIYGYEMTWSGGPGHMNTFATDGFVSRNNTELNNKTNDAGLRAYYQLLEDTPNSISQFNHPGETFGTFSDFAYLDPVIDARISLVEVGNGEGAVGSGAYFPSYEEYTKALDKGWHLAPTNNQDNHKGKWGDANTARTVIYTNDLSVDGLYDALRDMRVYATEDNNLDIVYTLNDEMLGSIIQDVPEEAEFDVSVSDPDSADKIQSISIITNGGKAIYTKTYGTHTAVLEKTIDSPAKGYYYIKVVEEDGQIAVTAPIWLGSAPRIGINSVSYDTMMPVTDESVTFTTKLFNNETEAAAVKSISYKIKDGSAIASRDIDKNIEANGGMYTDTQSYTFTQPGAYTVTVTAVLSLNGTDTTYTKDINLNVRDSEKLVYIGIDASHYNEYVAGNYSASMGNFAQLASKLGVRVVELKTSEELISAMQNPKYKMMIFTVPSRRNGDTTGRIPFKSYSQDEIDAAAAFAKSGGTVIITGWGDYYENYSNLKSDSSFTADQHMAAQQNKLLAAIGSSLRLADDEAKDSVKNGGQPQRLYLTDYNNYKDPFTQGVVDGQEYSQYGGSTIFAVDANGQPLSELPSSIIPTISGHATTSSSDDDKDGNAVPPKYNGRVLLMANETVTQQDGTKSTVIAAGGAFMSNFEIQVEVDNAGTLPYSNYNILQNIIASIANISNIGDVHNMSDGTDVVVEGIATTDVYNGSNSNKGFFDCIYVQDETGGINLFPVSSGVQAGQKIRVTGKVSEYQGEKQIQDAKVTVIDSSKNLVTPKSVTPEEAMSAANTGTLVKFEGTVTEIKKDNDGVVGQLMVSGARVYINGYITKNVSLSRIKVGDIVQVTGIASVGENLSSELDFLPRIRVRDRGEIVVKASGHSNQDSPGDTGTNVDDALDNAKDSLSQITGNGGTNGLVERLIENVLPAVQGIQTIPQGSLGTQTLSNGSAVQTLNVQGVQNTIQNVNRLVSELEGAAATQEEREAIREEIGTINVPMSSGISGYLIPGGELGSMLGENDLSLNLQYPDVDIRLSHGALPDSGSSGNMVINQTPVTDTSALGNFYIMQPNGKGVGRGYNITITQEENGQTNTITKLEDDLTLTFKLSQEDLEGVDPSTLRVFKMDEATGQLIDLGGAFISSQNALRVSTDHLCTFIVMSKAPVIRLFGDDRYKTSTSISAKGWDKSDNVILASGEDYPDALTAAVLAYVKNSPILLSGKDGISDDVLKEIERLGAKNIYIVGGPGVISKDVEAQLGQKYHTERISGDDRYKTAAAVGELIRQNNNFDTVVLATGENYPDALAIAPFAAKNGMPVMFTSNGYLNEDTKQALITWGIKKVIIVGGIGAVSSDVEKLIKDEMKIETVRLGGNDRYLTALEIAKYYNTNNNYTGVIIATGDNFPDALSGAPFAAKSGCPVLLVGENVSNQDAVDYINNLGIETIYIIGGTGAVPAQVEDKVK